MNVFVTGANGYLGGHVVRELLARGHDVYGMSAHGRVTYGAWGDLVGFLAKTDAVVHLSWYSSVGNGQMQLQRDCINSTIDLIDLVEKHCPNIQKFVFPSTASVYGNHPSRDFTEGDHPEPNCAYTYAKLAIENYVQAKFPLRHNIFRFGSLMGLGITRTKTDLVVNSIAIDAYKWGVITLWNPESWKPVLHVKDAAHIVAEAVERSEWNGIVNAASASIKAIHLAEMGSLLLSADVKIVEDSNGPRSCRLNCDVLKRQLPELHYRSIREAMLEFIGYTETINDKNRPWIEPASALPDAVRRALESSQVPLVAG